MKIAIVTETYPPEINGVALTVQSMVEHSLGLGQEVVLVRPRQPGNASVQLRAGLTQHLVPGMPVPRYDGLRLGLPVLRRMRRIFRRDRPQAVYVATEGPLGWAAIREARGQGMPILTGFHTRFDHYAQHYGLSIARRSVVAYLRRLHNAADATLVPTRELKRILERQGYQKVHVLERAVDTNAFSPQLRSYALRAEWGLRDRQLAVLCVGRIAAEKNLNLGVRAFRAIQENHPDARFVLVGDGPERAALAAAHPDLLFCGTQTGVDLARHYASADLFLFPSLSETFGNVVLEALASELPVSAFDYAAAADFVRPCENGFLARPGDEEGFIRNAKVLANIARVLPDIHINSRKSVRHLEPQSVAHRLIELFLEAVNGPQEIAA